MKEEKIIKGYKGFDKNMACKGFKFEEGKTKANNTKEFSLASNTGDYSAASNTGYQSAASVSGKQSIACGLGKGNKVKGALTCWLVLTEWHQVNDEWQIKEVKSVKVDGEKIKADTWYKLENGKIKEE